MDGPMFDKVEYFTIRNDINTRDRYVRSAFAYFPDKQ